MRNSSEFPSSVLQASLLMFSVCVPSCLKTIFMFAQYDIFFEDDYEGDKRNIFGDELLIHTVLLLLNRNQLILNKKK